MNVSKELDAESTVINPVVQFIKRKLKWGAMMTVIPLVTMLLLIWVETVQGVITNKKLHIAYFAIQKFYLASVMVMTLFSVAKVFLKTLLHIIMKWILRQMRKWGYFQLQRVYDYDLLAAES